MGLCNNCGKIFQKESRLSRMCNSCKREVENNKDRNRGKTYKVLATEIHKMAKELSYQGIDSLF